MADIASVVPMRSMTKVMDALSRELVTFVLQGREGLVSLPIVYPGGQPVTVHVRPDDDQFIVSDGGNGFISAEHMGASETYLRVAPGVAKLNGIEFDGISMFSARVPLDWLASAVTYIAAASKAAVERTAEKLTTDIEERLRDSLKTRLRDIFRDRASFDVDVIGTSTKKRRFAAKVQSNGTSSFFDVVTPSPVSVNFAIVKFQDIRSEQKFRGVALLSDKLDAGDYSMLANAATQVIPYTTDKQVLEAAA